MIHLLGVTKIFNAGAKNAFCALDDISFHIQEGEVVLLKGASGSGKSTLLSLMAGLSKPSRGEVIVADKRLSKLPDNFAALFRRREIGFIFQKFNLIPTLSVYDNIITPLIPSNMDEKQMHLHADALLHRFDIFDKKETLVKHLSGGEQQRVVIARALINTPRILLCDEPTANLDASLCEAFIQVIRELKKEGKTIIIATHDSLFFDLDCIDRSIEISRGKLV